MQTGSSETLIDSKHVADFIDLLSALKAASCQLKGGYDSYPL